MFRASSNWRYAGSHQFQAGVGSNVLATAGPSHPFISLAYLRLLTYSRRGPLASVWRRRSPQRGTVSTSIPYVSLAASFRIAVANSCMPGWK
jgi:hypothetical protein